MRQTACARRSLSGMINGGTRGREPNVGMRRRDFMSLLGGGAVAWPLAARAQQPGMPMMGFLSSGFPEAHSSFLDAFRTGLGESSLVSYVEVDSALTGTVDIRLGSQ
jgi:hypothetical protein